MRKGFTKQQMLAPANVEALLEVGKTLRADARKADMVVAAATFKRIMECDRLIQDLAGRVARLEAKEVQP